MSFAAPLWLAGAAGLSLLVVALHLLARRQPKPLLFPTARFIPELPASAPAAARRPSDLLLLLLRVSVLLLLGAAFARPRLFPPRHTLSMVLLDVSRAAPTALDDSLLTLLNDAALVLAFDSTPRRWPGETPRDTVAAPGSLSAALLGAVRRAPALGGSGDSLALHIISPFAAEEWDAATLAIRKLWQGGIVLHQVAAAEATISVDGRSTLSDTDPLAATLALIGPAALRGARLVRDPPRATDSAWALAGGAVVYWPRPLDATPWQAGPGDTVGGVASEDYAVAAPLVRRLRPPAGRIVARWPDGTAAATERTLGRGCQRDVAIPTDDAGDLALRPSMLALTRELMAPCGGRRNLVPITASLLDSLRGSPSLLATAGLSRPASGRVPANGWLLAAAVVLLAAEPLVRRSRR